MATKIEWVRNPDGSPGEVWNPVTGCTKVSEGCRNCYAERMHNRFSDTPFSRVVLHEDRLDQPIRWKKPRTVFVCSMGDLFHEDVPPYFINDVIAVIRKTPRHRYIILTKRPKHMRNRKFPDNVIIGTSIEDQFTALTRVYHLTKAYARYRMVSYEPALKPVDLCQPYGQGAGDLLIDNLDWVVMGGESGPGARPMHPEWARSMRDQCAAAGVPFFFKQWGEWAPFRDNGPLPANCRYVGLNGMVKFGDLEADTDTCMGRVGKKAAGRMLDGRTHDEMPEMLTR